MQANRIECAMRMVVEGHTSQVRKDDDSLHIVHPLVAE